MQYVREQLGRLGTEACSEALLRYHAVFCTNIQSLSNVSVIYVKYSEDKSMILFECDRPRAHLCG